MGTGTRIASRPALRVGPVSAVWRPRQLVVCLGLLVALVLAFAANVGRGDYPVPLLDVLAVLGGAGDDTSRFVVLELRLPRSLTGVLVGAALGMSGAVLQSVARNPLASPDLLGITWGASAAAVGLIVLGGGSAVGLPLAALAGGLATSLLLHLLAWRDGLDGFRLVLVGIGLSAVLVACTTWLLVSARIEDATRAVVWITGSLNGRGWEHVLPVGIAVAVVGALALAGSRTLAALRLSDDSARALGLRLRTGQSAVLLLAVALASIATASAGPVAFVALVAPQVALRLLRTAGPPLLGSALVGALLLVTSDLVARTVLPVELPVGIVTAAIGGPFLLHLLVRRNRESAA